VFGNAIAVFQRCSVLGRQPMQGQKNTYTAQGRKLASDPSGFSFHLCTVGADKDLASSSYTVKSYFGRPWKAYSRTVWMQCSVSSAIDPAGWLPWDSSNPFINTLYYGEFQNTGVGAATSGRVAWPGVHPSMSRTDALAFTVQNFISGSSWLPTTQASFQASLS
jgi:pectinesterase